ncbi:MAG: cupredoxin domain-containing protein [Chloroflexi bacterium]|nr:cupredoxin domain-containing protein [Chloroflexota bacterium]
MPTSEKVRTTGKNVTRKEARNESLRRRPGRKPGSRLSGLRAATFGLTVLVVLGTAAYFLWPALKPLEEGNPGAVTVQLSMAGFAPFRIEAKTGEPLTLRFVNRDTQFHTDGGGWHQFAIDELDSLDVKVPPQTTKEFTFTPGKAGEFEFYCDVCCGGRENPAMVGTLAVRS